MEYIKFIFLFFQYVLNNYMKEKRSSITGLVKWRVTMTITVGNLNNVTDFTGKQDMCLECLSGLGISMLSLHVLLCKSVTISHACPRWLKL